MTTAVKGGYGLGLSVQGFGRAARFGHGGSNEGFRCQMTAFREQGRGAVIMTNGERGGWLAAELLRAIAEEYDVPYQALMREILRNTRAELKDLGFVHTRVDPLGGAYARFEPDGAIVIWGTSDEYGCCDKQEAARMTARTYPGRPVRIEA